jgi:tetratricopeptide (TPR) repeat protein
MPGPITLESVSVAARRLSNFLATHGAELGPEDALAIARGAVALAPLSESHNALAGVLNDIPGAEDLQIAAAEAAVADDAENWAAWHNMSLALLRLYRWNEAAQATGRALRLLPAAEANPYIVMQAAFIAGMRGRHGQALGFLDNAVAVADRLESSAKPADVVLAQTVRHECTIARFVAHANMGAWPEAFAALALRFETSPARDLLTQAAAAGRLWVPGTEPKHKDVIVVLEWGLGDQIQFARYVPELVKQGVFAGVSVACSAPLQTLIRSLDGIVACMDRDALTNDALDSYEIVPGLDLMADYYKRTGDPVGGVLGGGRGNGYLKAPRNSTPEFEREPGKLAVAFSWQGDPRQTHDWARRLPLADFGQWASAKRDLFSYVSLQTRFAGYGEPWAGWPDDVPVHDASATVIISDLGDIADWIEAADVFVGQCGGLVHLAGALGKPGVVMLAASHDWRWDQTPPLYGSIVPVVQDAPGDWSSAFAKLADTIYAVTDTPPPVEAPAPAVAETLHADAPAAPVVVETLHAAPEPVVDTLVAPAEVPADRLARADVLAGQNAQGDGAEPVAAAEPVVEVPAEAPAPEPVVEVPAEPVVVPAEAPAPAAAEAAVAEPVPDFAHLGDEETAAYWARQAAAAAGMSEQAPAQPAAISTEGETQQ